MTETNTLEKIKLAGPLFVAIGAIMWSTDFYFRPILASAFGPTIFDVLTIVLFEHIVAIIALILFLYVYFNKRSETSFKYELGKLKNLSWLEKYAGIHIGIASALGNIFFTLAILEAIGPNFTAGFDQLLFVQKIQPLFAILLAYFLLKERLSWKFYIVLIPITLFGLFLVNFGVGSITLNPFSFNIALLWQIDLSSPSVIITIYGLLAAFLWGTGTVFGRVLVTKVDYQITTLVRYIVALTILVIANVIFFPQFIASVANGFSGDMPQIIAGFIFIGIVPGVASLYVYYYGLRNSKASYATIAELAYPVSGVLINAVFNGANMYPMQWLGGIIMLPLKLRK